MTDTPQSIVETEYKEACSTYRMGAQVGVGFLGSYFLINGILGAFFGAAANLDKPSRLLLAVIPILAILISALVFGFIPHFKRHLNGVLDRCVIIEEQMKGPKLFTEIAKISKAAKGMNAFNSLRLLSVLMFLFWGFILLFLARAG